MDQIKLFFNVTNDAWKFAKSELIKSKAEMTDDDWERVVNACSDSCRKYGKLGEREQALACSVFSAFLEYIDREDKVRTFENGHCFWKKKNS